ncbi:hypothetical protein RchiOBHm_Chr7g0243491 [Rosa chinensis]|uniref:Uncharacterized protein n=1 Tax=Rosa chinensis TaxID=74649 RepID=A0A2P6PIR5_ROSCH|nr:hypothetical protein RchiOBHm_Chr7g0243491 [Rosa chinensis]
MLAINHQIAITDEQLLLMRMRGRGLILLLLYLVLPLTPIVRFQLLLRRK